MIMIYVDTQKANGSSYALSLERTERIESKERNDDWVKQSLDDTTQYSPDAESQQTICGCDMI